MKYILGKNTWKSFETAEKECFLITNGLGGYCSLSVIGSLARGDHALLMGSGAPAPNHRIHMLSNILESLIVGGRLYALGSQRFVTSARNLCGYHYLNQFSYEYVPQWYYQVGDIQIRKTISMEYGRNTVILFYDIDNFSENTPVMQVDPMIRRTEKNTPLIRGQLPGSEEYPLYCMTNGEKRHKEAEWTDTLYFSMDAADGRDADGVCFADHEILFKILPGKNRFYIIYSMDAFSEADLHAQAADEIWLKIENEIQRQKALEAQAEFKNQAANMLVKQADAYIVKRDSTGEKSIIAGYPFFGDWGRDTMIALLGCTLSTNRLDDAKSILTSFMKYENHGLMPNLFPEGDSEPMYNTVDASLLFINAIYLYYKKTGDLDFIKEAWPVMTSVINWYIRGTDYNIHMDEDGLIIAGEGLWQVTWMDVRFEEILPTPRHGKPVEINAYWYNALKIMSELSDLVENETMDSYDRLARQVRTSFLDQFWNETDQCLKDVISGTSADHQIRCNQIWALSLPFTMLDQDRASKVLNCVFRHLYTPWGLRSLSLYDPEFHAKYGGPQFDRDMAYHQGTVWTFPLGAFYKSWIRFAKDQKEAAIQVLEWLENMDAAMAEGCIGHLPEIYDGLEPCESRGCFAQAWSVGEILSAYEYAEEVLK